MGTFRFLPLLILASLGSAFIPVLNAAQESRRQAVAFRTETLVTGLEHAWSLVFLPDGGALVTERQGRLRRITPEWKLLPEPIAGTPAVWARGQGGLLDLELHPDHERNGWIYLSYSRPFGGKALTQIVRGRITDSAWTDEEVLFEATEAEATAGTVHFGCRIRFDDTGHFWFAIGDRGNPGNAQRLDTHRGKLMRLKDDGSVPADNPYREVAGAKAALWSVGHRNIQGLFWDRESRELWATEHGPRGGDELNRIQGGSNYGWPVVTFGINYNGTPISELTEKEGLESPRHHWTPSIGTSGLIRYRGNLFPEWQGDFLVGGLALQTLQRVRVRDGKVTEVEELLRGIGRVRDVREGPEGAVYIVLDGPGNILRLTPE